MSCIKDAEIATFTTTLFGGSGVVMLDGHIVHAMIEDIFPIPEFRGGKKYIRGDNTALDFVVFH